jgi:KDO2-lipid IV(A) lauroyltransferase
MLPARPMTRASEQTNLGHPRHWPMWGGLAFFRLLSRLPWRVQRGLAAMLGWLCYYLVPVRRRVVLINLRLCFPEKTGAERRRLARAHYQSLALGVFEACVAWWAPARRLPRHELVGREHLAAAQAGGRGVILLTAHFTTMEIYARLLSEQVRYDVLYREPNNPVLAREMRRRFERLVALAIHFDDLRGLVRALKAGHIVWYAPDQGQRTKQSALIPFFGVPAVTNTATSRLAGMTGAAVVPYFARRRADGSYLLTLLPALENFPSADAAADTLRINRLIEAHARLAPEQYFWAHKRFKGRGPGLPDVYAR